MARTVLWISYMFGYLLVLLPIYFKAKRLRAQGKMKEFRLVVVYRVRQWATKLLYHIGVQVEVIGAENLPQKGETVVYVANHQSFLDIPVLLAHLDEPHGLLAKKELGKVPLLRGWMDLLGCLYVERADMRSGVEVLKKAEQWVKDGNSFIIFPEGTRSKGEEMAEFKAGAVPIAYKAGARVVPVAIDGSYRGLEGNGFRLKRCKVRLTVLPGVETAGLGRQEQKQLPGQLHDMILAAKDEGK